MNTQWFCSSDTDVIKNLNSNQNSGLTQEEVISRRNIYGYNSLKPAKKKSALLRFFLQIHQPLIYVLILSATLALFLGEYVDALVIYGVVLGNAIMGFWQENTAIKGLNKLSQNIKTIAHVIRDYQNIVIDSSELVPGDIVLLHSGEKVPADIRLLQSTNLQVDESPLTGESVPVEKENIILPQQTLLADRKNMLFSSTLITYGCGKGIVVETGDNTQIGQISDLINNAEELKTPLTEKIEQFSQKLLWLIVIFSLLAFFVGLFKNLPIIETLMSSIAMAVAAIPEGLPAAVTIILAIGVNRMLKNNAIVKKLPAVETLGSTSIICTDKTGTLTENKMTVQKIYFAGQEVDIPGNGYKFTGFNLKTDNQAMIKCLQIGALCNTASVDEKEKIEGDPTEVALLVSALKYQYNYKEMKEKNPVISEIPFESQYQYMACLHQDKCIYVKGATEVLLPFCTKEMDKSGKTIPLNRSKIITAMENYSKQGLRVLCFAIKPNHSSDNITHQDIETDLIFVGLQVMIDLPRPEAIKAIKTCHQAGIKVKMITGDHLLTAKAIAKQMNLQGFEKSEPATMNGSDLTLISDDDLFDKVKDIDVFARVSPQDKLRLVRAFQSHRYVVAMTGDGINDAPALKQADIGVAMGNNGTDVAKEAADIVLMDDNFATIEKAVEEGRGVFDNLIKFILWTLPISFAEALLVMIAIFFNLIIPISPVQILWINMVTTILLGTMFSFEPIDKSIMKQKPRSSSKSILSKGVSYRIISVMSLMTLFGFLAFYLSQQKGADILQARTVVVNCLVFMGITFMFSCRSFRLSIFTTGLKGNIYMVLGAFLMIILQILFTTTYIFQKAFKTVNLSMYEWGIAIFFSILLLLIIEFEKMIIRNTGRKKGSV